MFNFFLLKFLFFQILCWFQASPVALGPGRPHVPPWHPSPCSFILLPLPPHSLSCHGLSISWNTSSRCYLSARAAFCWAHMERNSFSLRGDQADTALGANSSMRARTATSSEIAQTRTKAFLPADPNNVCWGWWLTLLLKRVFFIISSCWWSWPAGGEAGGPPRAAELRLQLERGSSGYETKDSQSSGILLFCQQTDTASC